MDQLRVSLYLSFVLILFFSSGILGQSDTIPTFGERFETEESNIVSIGHKNLEKWDERAPSSGYSNYEWKKLPSPNYAPPPKLEDGESINDFQGVASGDGYVIWVVNAKIKNKLVHYLLSWNINSGDTKRTQPLSEKISSMAWDNAFKVLLVRTSSNLLTFSLKDLKQISSKSFPNSRNDWTDMLVMGNELVFIGQDKETLECYDKLTLAPTRVFKTGVTKLQRIFLWNEDTILLWSSFLGAKIVFFIPSKNQVDDTISFNFPFRSLFKATTLGEESLGVFDFFKTKYVGQLIKHGKTFINLNNHVEIDQSGIGIRHSPKYQMITAYAKVMPNKNIKSGKVVFALPHKSNYEQEILEESIEGDILTDSYGNRFGVITLPDLDSGNAYEIEIYKAKIARFRSSFDFLKARPEQNFDKSFERYFKDHPIYNLTNSIVKDSYDQIISDDDTYLTKIFKIHEFAKKIKPLWDGKNEPVPNVLKNKHGGCNEHTRVQVAFLQIANIPGRYAWNHIYRESDDKDFTIDHAIAEAWITGIGWIPLEGLGGRAGALSPYLFFDVGFPESSVVWRSSDVYGQVR